MLGYDRDGVIASGAADDAIRLFVENQEDLVYFLHFIVVSLYQDWLEGLEIN